MSNKKILILSSYDTKYKNIGLGQLSDAKNKEYADKHGYSYECRCEDSPIHYFFYKFHLIKEKLPLYDYILWIDSDAFIVNHSKTIQDFIPDEPSKIITLVIDQENINTGVFILKNDPTSFEILNSVITYGPKINHPLPDAFVLRNIFDNNPHIVNYIKPQKLLNAYKYELYRDRMPPNPDGEFEEGLSFILHFPGMPLQTRVDAYNHFNVKEMR